MSGTIKNSKRIKRQGREVRGEGYQSFLNVFPGVVDITDVWNVKEKSLLTFIDLFSGAGGMSKGFEMAGFKGIAGVEYNPNASATYNLNFEHECITGDITLDETINTLIEVATRNLNGKELDILAGGFPCQGFSNSGKRKVEDPRNSLYQYVVKVASLLRPKYIIGENVPGLLTMKYKNGKKVAAQIIEDFEKIGYDMDCMILHSEDYGVAQKRDRLIFVGTRMGNQILFPKPMFWDETYKTVGDAILDLMDMEENKVFNHTFVKSKAKTLAKFAKMKEGDRISEMRNDSCGRLFLDQPSWTMKHNNGHPAIHPILNRILSPREMARLQSFPDDFIFASCPTQNYKQIGNAVPPLLGKAIGLGILEMEHQRLSL